MCFLFFFFWWFISIYFSTLFAFLFLSFSILFTFYPLSPFYPLEKFWPQPFKKPGNGTLSTRYLAYFTTTFAPKIGHVFSGIALPEFGRYSNGHTYGWTCPCRVSCLSKQSGVARKWWRHKGFNVSQHRRQKNTTLDMKELSPNSDKHLISPYSVTSWSDIQVMRIKEMVIKGKMSWCWSKFSQL